MDEGIAQLSRQVRQLKRYAVATTLALLGIGILGFRSRSPADDVLRVRGIIVVDAAGRERILIGAPVPDARNRVRTDTARARAAWGYMSPRYMEYYKSYRHSMNGIVVLDESGIDRLAMGDSVPDPNIGQRIGPSTGIAVNDARGFERTGYGLLQLGKETRVSLGLDSRGGLEGVSLWVDDDGLAGIRIQDRTRMAQLGIMRRQRSAGQPADTVVGLRLRAGKTADTLITAPTP